MRILCLLSVLRTTQCWLAARATPLFSKTCRSALSIEEADLLKEKENQQRPTTTKILADHPSFIVPDRDQRQYRVVQLPNHLICLLVCDNITNGVGVEAASVHVQAGHFDDTLPGLAHFHEHMLFLGTKKYPVEGEYEKYLGQHGGFSNAATDMEDTSYFFSITTDAAQCFVRNPTTNVTDNIQTTPALHGALDQLAQFFVAPLFTEDAVEREVQAIHSEYRNYKTNDAWRQFQLLKSLANPNHPFSKFGCGNVDTLMKVPGKERLLQELQTFWDTYYQSYNCRLAVVGHGSLDALQRSVEETFGQVPFASGTPRHRQTLPDQSFVREHAVYKVPAFGTAQLGKCRNVIPFTEKQQIKIFFATPPLDDPAIRHAKPYRSLSHFLGHEAPGSLHAVLSEMGYLNGLSSGVGQDTSDFSLFSLTLALTPKGMKEKESVLDLVFQWIALLNQQDESKLAGYHEELRNIGMNNFRFAENSDPSDFCSSAAGLLFEEDLDYGRLLIHSVDTDPHDPKVEQAFLDRLRPSNCMIHIVDSKHDDSVGEWKTEKWYGARYSEQDISQEQIQAWDQPEAIDSRLRAPELNKYIPTDFSLRCDDNASTADSTATKEALLAEPPNLLIDTPKLRMWHKMDRYWRVPKAFIRISLESPSIYASPRSITLNRIFQKVLKDDLNSFVYDASLAGCSYRVACTPNGYRLSVSGYSEKLPFLLDTLTTRILSLIEEMKSGDAVLREKFDKAKVALLRETKNYRLDSPYEIANYNSRLLVEENVWYLDNYIDEMEGEEAERHPLTMEECAVAAEESLTTRVRCESLCMGNIDETHAREVAGVLEDHFLVKSKTLNEVELQKFRSIRLPTREEAAQVYGNDATKRPFPVVYQELAYSNSEENNAVEIVMQAGSELDLGYEGVATLDLISHIAYTSAFGALRTKEQLGYIVAAQGRRTAGGGWGMSLIVQSSVALPEVLEERCEEWLKSFREELREMSPVAMAREASAVAAQYMETETTMAQEVQRVWGEIVVSEGLSDSLREPNFQRLDLLADALTVSDESAASELKQRVLAMFDKSFASSSPTRRAMVARVYSHDSKADYEASLSASGVLSTYSEMRYLKQFTSSLPVAPYWRIREDDR